VSSGLRIGSPALATRGLQVDDFVEVGKIIGAALTSSDFEAQRGEFAQRVEAIAERYPLYAQLGAAAAAV
jgi:glycine hydroxymethyltransferase